jgi:DNA (cytosine-5)-methyltransferase 1
MPDGRIVLPDIRDAERLQGFPADWTSAATGHGRRGTIRWKLVGNAVSVPVAHWIGERLDTPDDYDASGDEPVSPGAPWPTAGWGGDGTIHRVQLSPRPVQRRHRHLADVLRHETRPLSARATLGFLRRARASSLRFPDGFLDDVERHLQHVLERDTIAA